MWSTEHMDPERLHDEVSQQIKLLSPKNTNFVSILGYYANRLATIIPMQENVRKQ